MITVDLAARSPALLVLDLQVAFSSPGGAFGNDAGPVIERLNGFLRACRGRGLPVIFSSYLLRPDLADAGLLRENPAAAHFTDGAPGAGLDPRLERDPADLETRHHRPGALHESELGSILHGLGCDALLLTGLSVNNAVSTTAREAFARDIPALVVRDLVGSAPWEPPEWDEPSFAILATWTAEVAESAAVLERLDAAASRRPPHERQGDVRP